MVAREFSRVIRPENFEDYGLLQAFVDSRTLLYLPDGPIDFSRSAKEEKRRRGELAQSKIVLPFGVGYENGRFFY